jgi:hypothetical protein
MRHMGQGAFYRLWRNGPHKSHLGHMIGRNDKPRQGYAPAVGQLLLQTVTQILRNEYGQGN